MPQSQIQQPHKHRLLGALLSTLSVLILAAAMYLYGSYPIDMVKAALYHPSSQMVGIDQRITLTDRGTQILYATSPMIEAKTQFNQSCQSTERSAAILGCYGGDRIYLYDIQNPELDGTLEVTAAHEMLHAAYYRLNVFDRQRVDAMIRDEYAKIKDDPSIKQIMQYYTKAEPGAEIDELHSIIGTTIANLDPNLENYYKTYFKNRAAVVALNAAYNAVFNQVNDQANALQAKINLEWPPLKSDMASYSADLEQLNLDIDSFNQRAKSGDFSSQSAFTTARNALLARSSELDARRTSLNQRVDEYNADVEALNKLAIRVNELNQSINGVAAPTGV